MYNSNKGKYNYKTHISPKSTKMKHLQSYPETIPFSNGNRPLSKREQQIFEMSKLPEKEIAHCLFISRETVKNHMTAIRRKTGTLNKAEVWGLYQSIKRDKYIN